MLPEGCAMCGQYGTNNFVVEDLPVGPRTFCTEKHFAQYAGLPVKESGYYGFEAEGELERKYFARFGDKRGGKEWGEYNFTWFNDVGDWKPIDKDTTGWDEDDYDSFRDNKEYDLVNQMLDNPKSSLYGKIENNTTYTQEEEFDTTYKVLNEDGDVVTLNLLMSWDEPEIEQQKIQYYDKEPLLNLEFLAESFEARGYEYRGKGWLFYATSHSDRPTTVMHPIKCGHYKMVMDGTGVWMSPTFYDTIEEMVEDQLNDLADAILESADEQMIQEYKNLKTVGEARKWLSKTTGSKLNFAPCFKKEYDYDSKALNALPITPIPFDWFEAESFSADEVILTARLWENDPIEKHWLIDDEDGEVVGEIVLTYNYTDSLRIGHGNPPQRGTRKEYHFTIDRYNPQGGYDNIEWKEEGSKYPTIKSALKSFTKKYAEYKGKDGFEAESFEATEWIGFCPECNKWRTKEMSKIFKNNRKDKNDEEYITDLAFNGWTIPKKLLGKQLCMRGQRFGNVRSQTDSFTGYGQRTHNDSYCGTPLTKVKSKYKSESFEAEFDFIHCSNCLFSKTGLNRCEVCNTEFVCRSQHGEDCNCYLFNAESFKSDEDLRITCPNCHGSKKMRIIDPLSDPYDPFPKYHKPIFYCLHCGGREGKMTTAQIEYDLRGMDELNPNWKEVFPIEKYGAESFEATECNTEGCENEAGFYDKAKTRPIEDGICIPCFMRPSDPEAAIERRMMRRHSSETKKMNPLEKAGISGMASGATLEGLETLLAAESFASWSEHTCEHCGSTDIDFGNNWKCHDCGRYAAEEGIYEVITQQQVDDEMVCEGCPHTFKVGDSYVQDGDHPVCVTCAKDFKTCIDCEEVYNPEGEHKWAKTCSYCRGSGFILTSYTSASYDDPADGDGDDCGACDGLGYVCEEGEGYGAESYAAEQKSISPYLWGLGIIGILGYAFRRKL